MASCARLPVMAIPADETSEGPQQMGAESVAGADPRRP